VVSLPQWHVHANNASSLRVICHSQDINAAPCHHVTSTLPGNVGEL
jgi:hypothetical protein